EEAARRIVASAIREQLLAALVDWSNIKTDPADRKKLVALIRLADRNQWRQGLLDALDRNDRPSLSRLAQSAEALTQPPARLAAFGAILAKIDQPACVQFLRQAQQRYPDDFWINYYLAANLANLKPPRVEEAITFYRVAVALRRQSPGAHVNLG